MNCHGLCEHMNILQANFKTLDTISNGSTIIIEGYFIYEFEGVRLVPHKNSPYKKGLWINFNRKYQRSLKNTLKKLSYKKVLVVGIIDFDSHGHMDLYGGELQQVCCIRKL